MDKIRKLATGYKGTPENFDLKKASQKSKPKTRSPNSPKSALPSAPTALGSNINPTEQKNVLLLADSIFGMDVPAIPIQPCEDISTSVARLPEIAMETYNQRSIDERQIVIAKEEVSYYVTSLMWKLMEGKAKQNREALTSEKDQFERQQRRKNLMCLSLLLLICTRLGSLERKWEKHVVRLKDCTLDACRARAVCVCILLL